MRISARCLCQLVFAVFIACAAQAVQAGKRPWTVEDSIGVTYFERGHTGWSLSGTESPLKLSPDGAHVFYITRRGDLSTDSNLYQLKVFSLETLERALRRHSSSPVEPFRVVTLASRLSDNELAGLSRAKWVDEGLGIAFLGARGDDPPQLMRLDLASGEIQILSYGNLGVRNFDMVNGVAIYQGISEKRARTKLRSYPATFVDATDFGEVLGAEFEYRMHLYSVRRGHPPVGEQRGLVDECAGVQSRACADSATADLQRTLEFGG